MDHNALQQYFLERLYLDRSEYFDQFDTDKAEFYLFIDPQGKLEQVALIRPFEHLETGQVIHLLRGSGDWKKTSEGMRIGMKMNLSRYARPGLMEMRLALQFFPITGEERKVMEKYVYKEINIEYDQALYEQYEVLFGAKLAKLTVPYLTENLDPKDNPQLLTVLVEKGTQQGEYGWLAIDRYENGQFHCRISRPPQYISGYAVGDPVVVPEDKILDWIMVHKGRALGEFTNVTQRNLTMEKNIRKLDNLLPPLAIVRASAEVEREMRRLVNEPDEQAQYEGDTKELQQYFLSNMVKRSNTYEWLLANFVPGGIHVPLSIKSSMYFSFVVKANGNIQNPRAVYGGMSFHQQDLLRALKNMGPWTPAKKNGQPVESLVVIDLKDLGQE